MRKIVVFYLLMCSFLFAHSQDLPGFSVEISGLTVLVSSSTFEKQLEYVAFRSVNPPYDTEFDVLFFQGAMSKLSQYDRSMDLILLEKWSEFFLGDVVVSSKELGDFEVVCKKLDLSPTKTLYSNNIETWTIGKTKLYIHSKQKKLANGYIKVSKQPGILGCFFLIEVGYLMFI